MINFFFTNLSGQTVLPVVPATLFVFRILRMMDVHLKAMD